MNLDEAREKLFDAARTYAIATAGDKTEDFASAKALCEAASLYAQERLKAAPKAQMKESTSLTMPFGKEKGVTIAAAKTANLEWMAAVIRESLSDPEKGKWRVQNAALLEAIERELETR